MPPPEVVSNILFSLTALSVVLNPVVTLPDLPEEDIPSDEDNVRVGFLAEDDTMLDSLRDMDGDGCLLSAGEGWGGTAEVLAPLLPSPPPSDFFASFSFAAANDASLHAELFIVLVLVVVVWVASFNLIAAALDGDVSTT